MSIEITTLPNGLTVVTDAMESVESVSVGVWVDTGTRNERVEINGVAHFVEHMVFKGTKRRTARAIAEEIEAVGGQINAYTSREHTAYYARILAGDLPLAIDVLGDILQNSTLEAAELERERQVILQEIGQAHDTPDDIVFDYFQSSAYPGQPMGWPVLGTAEVVGAMSRDVAFDYMRDHYVAGRMVMAAAGRVDHAALVDLAHESFGELSSGLPGDIEVARYKGGDYRETRDLEQIHLVLGFDGLDYRDEDFYALSVLSTLFGGGMSSRLFQEVRENRGLVYSIYSFTSSYADGGIFGIYAGTGEAEMEELLPVLAAETLALTKDVSAEEVQRARAQLKASVLMALESSWARCERLSQHLLTFGRIVSVEEIVAKIEAVDEAAVRRVAGRILSSRPTVAAVGPAGRLESYDAIAERFA
jgi:predicted Zn-dependent peptidase